MAHRELLKLAALLASIALATSRVGLIAHELLGHGGAALALGAGIEDWKLSWFGGGWIRYDHDGPWSEAGVVVVACAGIAIEIFLALALLALSRRTVGVSRLALTLGAGVLAAHACFYLAAGTHHGYGDGRVLFSVLAPWQRWSLVAVAGLGAVIAAGFVGRSLGRGAGGYLGGPRWQRFAVLAVAAVIAAVVHGALAIGEARLRAPDPTYARIMESQTERVTAAELARLEALAAARDRAFDRAAQRARLERESRPFPVAIVLVGAMLIAAAAATARGLGRSARDSATLRWREVGVVAAVAAVAVVITAWL